MSLDIGHRNEAFYLFEFQCLCLGQYTLEKSKFHYTQTNDEWVQVYETPDLEREIATTVLVYVTRDHKRSAHFEHTILITDGEPEILTKRE